MKASDRPAWLRRESVTDSHRRSSALAEHLRKLVEEGGETTHGLGGESMPYLISELELGKVPYTIVATPRQGYRIVVLPPAER